MSELWTFPQGTVGAHDSVKGYRVDGSDGHLGVVVWADYKPGDSYLVVRVEDRHRHADHLVPAGAITAIDHEARTVTLDAPVAEIRATATYEGGPEPAYVSARDWYEDQVDRGRAGGVAWPYTDI